MTLGMWEARVYSMVVSHAGRTIAATRCVARISRIVLHGPRPSILQPPSNGRRRMDEQYSKEDMAFHSVSKLVENELLGQGTLRLSQVHCPLSDEQ